MARPAWVDRGLLIAMVVAPVLLAACHGAGTEPGPSLAGSEAAAILSDLRARFVVGSGDTPEGAPVFLPGIADSFKSEEGGVRPHFAGSIGKLEARVLFPERSVAPLRIEDVASGAAIDVLLQDARDVASQTADGYVIYPRAHASGATILHHALPFGTEDFLSFDDRPPTPEVAYRVTLRKGVRGLRLVYNSLELVDAAGAPRLRVSPPYLIGADGVRTEATLAVAGCAVDTNTAAPWGRAATPPGAESCTVRVRWNDTPVAYPAVLDPRWTSTSSMSIERQEHTATLLPNGKVLVAGGRSGTATTPLSSAELYDRTTGTWTTAGDIASPTAPTLVKTPTRLHTAVLLHTAAELGTTGNPNTNGKVFVAGGINGTTTQTTVQTTSLYDVATNTWAGATAMPNGRSEHTATVLANNNVVVIGGVTSGAVKNTAAIYVPGTTGFGTWSSVTPTMSSGRRGHTATLLAVPGNTTLNNKILVVGGNNGGSPAISVNTWQIFDGVSVWTTAATLPSSIAREGHTATALPSGSVLIAGGKTVTSTATTYLQSAQLFMAPASGAGSWNPTSTTMRSKRFGHTATLLPAALASGGKVVLLIGGSTTGLDTLATTELWDGASTWTDGVALTTATPTPLGPVKGHTATLLTNNAVLIAGGVNGTTATPPPVKTAGLYDASFGLACTTNSQCATGFCVSGVCCDTACDGGCGSCNLTGKVGTCSAVGSGTTCPDDGLVCTSDACDGNSVACQHVPGGGVCAGNQTITYYQSYDHDTTLDIAAVPGSEVEGHGAGAYHIVHATGLYGLGQDYSSEPWLFYSSNDSTRFDVALWKSGSISAWIKPGSGFTGTQIMSVYDGNAGYNLFFIADGTGGLIYADAYRAPTDNHFMGRASLGWIPDNSWHLVVLNFSRKGFAVSVDGSAPQLAVAPIPELATIPISTTAGYMINPMSGGGPHVKDEVMIMNRQLGADEIAWYYNQAPRVVPNPAIAKFGPDDPGRRIATDVSVAPNTVRVRVDLSELLTLTGLTGVGLQVLKSSDNSVVASSTLTTWPGNIAQTDWVIPTMADYGYPASPNNYILKVTLNGLAGTPASYPFAYHLPACITPGDCQTGPGTRNVQTGLCDYPPVIDGMPCSDGDVCNGTETCSAGVCTPGAVPSFDDMNPCTTDWCDPVAGEKHAPSGDGLACNDDNNCTAGDVCQAGACVGATAVTCPPPDACHVAGTCNPSSGACSYPSAPAGTSCSDGDACNGADTCDQYGVCRSGTPVLCVASAGCSGAPTCNPLTGACMNPGGVSCLVYDASAPPALFPPSIATVDDPTPTMEAGCQRLRDIPVRFLRYQDAPGGSFVDSQSYRDSVVSQLNGSLARACLTFHDRGGATVSGTKFNDATPIDWSDPALGTAQWQSAVPFNPTCPLVPPATGATSGRLALLGYVLEACPINDEMVMVSIDKDGGGDSGFPTRYVEGEYGNSSHEVGHHLSLGHAHEEQFYAVPTSTGVARSQVPADYWDLEYLPGRILGVPWIQSFALPPKFYQTKELAQADVDAGAKLMRIFGNGHWPQGIRMPGLQNGVMYDLPPKTGPLSCDVPPAPPDRNALRDAGVPIPPGPDFQQMPCAAEDFWQSRARTIVNDYFCFNCEFRRVYEWYNDTTFPPAGGASLGFFFALGKSIEDLREPPRQPLVRFWYERAGQPPDTGFEARGLTPAKTKLQELANPNWPTKNAMNYEQAFTVAGAVAELPGFSPSQVALIKQAFKYDLETTVSANGDKVPPVSPASWGHRPAFGSWEKIGKGIQGSSPVPNVVPAPDGAFLTVKATDGKFSYRHWRYADRPWASWQMFPLDSTLAASAKLSSAFLPGVQRIDLIMDKSGDFQHTLLVPDGHGLSGWTSVGLPSVSGTPLSLARQVGGIDRLGVFNLSNTGVPSLDRYSFKEWDGASGTWSASTQLAFLGEPVSGGLDASVRPDGTMDLAGMFGEGRIVYNWFDGTSPTAWKEMGPLPNTRSGKRPTVSSGYFGGPSDTSGVVLTDVLATDVNGTIWSKEGRIEPAAWVPSNYAWIPIGGSNFGRVSAARNSRGEMDLVVRDFDRKTVRFKRLRNVGGSAYKTWSPSQDLWFDLGGQGTSDPVVVERAGEPDVVDIFAVDANGDMWHRAYVVPPYVSDPWKQQYEIDYSTYCCAKNPASPACPCIPQ